ncbi:MAG: CPBP family intramembrane glutamic endopeptidase [Myxococcota bacterium]
MTAPQHSRVAPPRRASWWTGPAHLGGYFVATLGWFLVLGVVVAALIIARGQPIEATTADLSFLGAWVPVLTGVQQLGMLAIAAVGAVFVGWSDPGPLRARVQHNLGMTSATVAALAVAAGLGLTAGQPGSWLSDRFLERYDWAPMVVDLIGDALGRGGFEAVTMAITVGLLAPVCEELIFRGYLWSAFERSAPPWVALVVTSSVFAAYHLDPPQVIGVVPIAFVLGWVRWHTGSVWPGVVMHVVNNTFALAIAAWVPGASEMATPWWMAAGGTLLTLAGMGVVVRRA